MTLEEARVEGELEALRVALKLLVDAIAATENGAEIISALRKAAFDAVDASSKIGTGSPVVAAFEDAERKTLAFIFSDP